MRINKFVASASGLSRRVADEAIAQGRVVVDGQPAAMGQEVTESQHVTLDGTPIHAPNEVKTIIFNKPTGYVVSRNGQGSKTIYDLLPPALHNLNPVGRLDKDSSGLLLLTIDGELANTLTHPRFAIVKIYEVALDKPLEPLHHQMISDFGVQLEDGKSRLGLERVDNSGFRWKITMQEGRNRQIRRTFSAVGYTVTRLQRTQFGEHSLQNLQSGEWKLTTNA